MIKTFKTKPKTVKAIQYSSGNRKECEEFCGPSICGRKKVIQEQGGDEFIFKAFPDKSEHRQWTLKNYDVMRGLPIAKHFRVD